MFPSKILLQVSGSISCFKAAALASLLVKNGAEVQVVATPSALKFVGEATFEGLTSKAVQTEIFAQGQMMDHIHLARWAEAFVFYPASANSLNRLVLGMADDLIGALALAKAPEVPYFIAPAMNQQMWQHPSVQSSVDTLKSWGHILLEPVSGSLACGETGPGRLIEPEEMIERIEGFFNPKDRASVLITAGGTKEPLDEVRYITNMSTGRTSAQIAENFLKQGYAVTYLCSQDAARPSFVSPLLKVENFTDFNSLNNKLEILLSSKKYRAVIHAAAVSDYSLAHIEGVNSETRKIDSDGDITITLKRNFKILSRLRSYSKNTQIKVIGFKLTVGSDPYEVLKRINKMRQESAPDVIVHNDLSQISNDKHEGQILVGEDQVVHFSSKDELAKALLEALNAEVNL